MRSGPAVSVSPLGDRLANGEPPLMKEDLGRGAYFFAGFFCANIQVHTAGLL